LRKWQPSGRPKASSDGPGRPPARSFAAAAGRSAGCVRHP
jgi:hypothetical protein